MKIIIKFYLNIIFSYGKDKYLFKDEKVELMGLLIKILV